MTTPLTREQVIEITEENPVYLDKLALLRQTDAALRQRVEELDGKLERLQQFVDSGQLMKDYRKVEAALKECNEWMSDALEWCLCYGDKGSCSFCDTDGGKHEDDCCGLEGKALLAKHTRGGGT